MELWTGTVMPMLTDGDAVRAACEGLAASVNDWVTTADDAACPCASAVPEASVPAEVETGCATMTGTECDGAISSCASTVTGRCGSDGSGVGAVDAMVHVTGASDSIL